MSKIRRKALSLEEKLTILKFYDEKSQTQNQVQLAAELDLPVSTLRTILKNREDIRSKSTLGSIQRKKQKAGKFSKLENVLVQWLQQAQALKLRISGAILCEKALEIAKSLHITDFTASNGWIDRFKNRHGIVYCRNSQSETEDQNAWIATLSALLQNYEPQDIFNAVQFRMSLIPATLSLPGGTCHGGKGKERLSVLACTNSDGSEKIPLLVIGKENSSCIKNTGVPAIYDQHPEALLTGPRFVDWLHTLDNHFEEKRRQIILFIDNKPQVKHVQLRNMQLVFLPLNTGKQPMEQIVKILKQVYETELTDLQKEDSDCKQSLSDAILSIAAAWESIVPDTIQNCFREAGFQKNLEVKLEIEPMMQDCQEFSSKDDDDGTSEDSSIKYDPMMEDLVNRAKGSQNETDGDEKKATPILSYTQALTAVGDLRRYISSMADSEKAIQKLNYIESFITINDKK